MTLADGLIPTFQPGDRVRVTPRPTEWGCEHCGAIWGTTTYGNTYTGYVKRNPVLITCPTCSRSRLVHDGEYSVLIDNPTDGIPSRIAPYPWLMRIEDES